MLIFRFAAFAFVSFLGSACVYNEATAGFPSNLSDKAEQCTALGVGCALTGSTFGGLEPCEISGVDCCPTRATPCTAVSSYDECNALCNKVFGQSSTSYSSWSYCKVHGDACCEGPFLVSHASGFGACSVAMTVFMLAVIGGA